LIILYSRSFCFYGEKCFNKSHCPYPHQCHGPFYTEMSYISIFKVFILNYSFLNITDIVQKVHFL